MTTKAHKAGLFLLPFLDRTSTRRLAGRPVTLAAGALFLTMVLGLLAISLHDLYAIPRTDPAIAQGKAFVAHFNCTGCHRIHGEGGAIGPDLSYEGDGRPDRDWHDRHFRDPRSVSPGSIMPKFPLTDQELHDLTSYIVSLKKDSPARTTE